MLSHGLRQNLKWLDPFTYVDLLLEKINPSRSPWIDWPVYIISAFLFAFLIYTALGFALGTKSPMVIVVSESMSPVMHRGDVVVLTGIAASGVNVPEAELDVPSLKNVPMFYFAETSGSEIRFSNGKVLPITTGGDIVVYYSALRDEQIIHRAVARVRAADGTYLLTKGDNNQRIDQDCGRVMLSTIEKPCVTPFAVGSDELQGRAVGWAPLLGYVKLLVFDDVPVLLFGCKKPQGCVLP